MKTLIYRLRKLLGKESVLVSEGRISLNPKLCWIDIWSFQQTWEQFSNEQQNNGNTNTLSTLTQHLSRLYRGPFLAQNDATWALATREQLQGQIVRALDLCAEHAEQSGHWREAQALLQKGIDLDPLSENFYRRLMLCYHKLGQSAEALSIYRRCQRTLSVSLGISPSPETIAAANQLRSGS